MDIKLRQTLADVFGVRENEIIPELCKDDLDVWDSLKQMDLVMSLERAFDVSLGIEDIVQMTSVSSIIKILRDKGVPLED